MTKREWRADPDAEAILSYIGISWDIRDVCLDEIDWEESSNNCARLRDPLNEERIDDYRSSLVSGDVFPRIVVEEGRKGYTVLGGNQRCNALKRISDQEIVEAYCVKPLTTAERDSLIRSLNSRHGWGMDKAEKIEHAVLMVRSNGVSAADAAWLMKVSEVTILQRIRIAKTRVELAKRGVNSNAMSLSHLNELSRISDQELREQAAKEVERHSPTAESTNHAVNAVINAKSQASAIKKLREWSKEISAGKEVKKSAGRMKNSRREKMLRHLTSFADFLERGNDGSGFSSLDELGMSESRDGDHVRTLATKIVIRLSVIKGERCG